MYNDYGDYMSFLIIAAVLPVIILCYYIYNKDTNKEPSYMLMKVFSKGLLTFIPIYIVEVGLNVFFDTTDVTSFLLIFVYTFFGVALVEEFFKWWVVYKHAYNSREFDEVYDIIVYAVFVSLGFACIENVLYVINNGFGNAIIRAISAVPGHMYFGVIMGFFLSKAKVAKFNKNSLVYRNNMIFSLLFPTLFHTMYDSLIFYCVNTEETAVIFLFIIFHIVSVILCIIIINMTSKVQYNITNKISEGIITVENGNVKVNEGTVKLNYCPICGMKYNGGKYCGGCGRKF